MESDPASVPIETIQGNSIIMRLGAEKRLQKAYIPSNRIVKTYFEWIKLRNGKFLWVTNLRLAPQKITQIDNFIFYSPEADFSICAKIADLGYPYQPKEWKRNKEYSPILTVPEYKRMWIKCCDGKAVKLNPADYQILFERNGICENLKAAYDRADKAPYHYVKPIPELDEREKAEEKSKEEAEEGKAEESKEEEK